MIHSSEGSTKTALVDGVHATQVQARLPQSLSPNSFQKYMLATHKLAV